MSETISNTILEKYSNTNYPKCPSEYQQSSEQCADVFFSFMNTENAQPDSVRFLNSEPSVNKFNLKETIEFSS